MFCYKCGTALPDDACFCYKCGIALNINCTETNNSQANQAQSNNSQPNYTQPNYSQPAPNSQPTPAQQPAPSYNPAPVKGGANVVYPDGHNEIGDLYISPAEIRFVRKSKAVRVAFGFVGSAMENGQEALRLNVSDIVSGNRTRIGLNSNVYQITMRNGDTYRFCLNQPKNIAYLEQVVRNR